MRKSPGNDETNFSSFQPIVVAAVIDVTIVVVVITTVVSSNIPIVNIIFISIIVMGRRGDFFSLQSRCQARVSGMHG